MVDHAELVEFAEAYPRTGSLRACAAEAGKTYKWAHRRYVQAVAAGLINAARPGVRGRLEEKAEDPPAAIGGQLRATQAREFSRPGAGEIKRYLFTCAQNDTKIHEPFWTSLQTLAKLHSAEIHVSRFTYIKSGLGAEADKANLTRPAAREKRDRLWFDPRLTPYFSDERASVAPGLIWCGEMNILPTAVRPLSGMDTYTGRASGIFPHVKIAMESVPAAAGEATKFNYTTGTVTLRNYVQRKAGLKAEFHHCYGALLVEVTPDGWWCRQINADSHGTIHDLGYQVSGGAVTLARPEAITWGDIHVAEMDQDVREACFGPQGVLNRLWPKRQFLHDVLHFRGRSHHEIKNPHVMFLRHVQGATDVRKEVMETHEFLKQVRRPWCESIVVDSNHHHHIGRWLAEQDGRDDPLNVEYWLALNGAVYGHMRAGQKVSLLALALCVAAPEMTAEPPALFLREDQSYIICEDEHGGVECGMHGDLGPNGSRGSARAFLKLARRINRGHEHSASIVDGVYTSGTCGIMNPDWTHGPSSWSHSHILTYANGKRAILTMWKGKAFA